MSINKIDLVGLYESNFAKKEVKIKGVVLNNNLEKLNEQLAGMYLNTIYKKQNKNKYRNKSAKKINNIKDKNNLSCELCNYQAISKNMLRVHHIIPRETINSDVMNYDDNLICLCCNCHELIHTLLKTPELFKTNIDYFIKNFPQESIPKIFFLQNKITKTHWDNFLKN